LENFKQSLPVAPFHPQCFEINQSFYLMADGNQLFIQYQPIFGGTEIGANLPPYRIGMF